MGERTRHVEQEWHGQDARKAPSGPMPHQVGEVLEGRVKRLVFEKGFGFIGIDGGWDVFFHRSSMANGSFDTLREGTKVTFTVAASTKGPRANDMRIV